MRVGQDEGVDERCGSEKREKMGEDGHYEV